jgi:hypothetical protein
MCLKTRGRSSRDFTCTHRGSSQPEQSDRPYSVWALERVGDQVHYVSLAVNDQVYNLDLFYASQSQPAWTMEDIDLAFQMDVNGSQQPYNVWLDNVTLNAY